MNGLLKSIVAVYFILFALAGRAQVAPTTELIGSWSGKLNVGAMSLTLVLNLEQADGYVKVSLDSPDQGARGISAFKEFLSDDSVAVKIQTINASYRAKLKDGKFDGTFSQNGFSIPITMTRSVPEVKRPQNPQPAGTQTFSDDFTGRTLRLDYVLAGNNHEQHIYFSEAMLTSPWAGRRARLAEAPLRGNGQIALSDHETGRLLYVHTFSTLFQEWQATEEATRLNRAFPTCFNVPMPKRKVDVSVTLTDFHANVVGQLQHTIDPADILIREISEPQVPYHYVWKGCMLPAEAEKMSDNSGHRNFVPTEGSLDGEADITACIDLAIVAEGYTRQQMGKFYQDCERAVEALFAHEPFTSMKQRFNVVAVAAESVGSGPSVPHIGRWRQTPVGTHYDTFYVQRYLMTTHMPHLYDQLAGIPFEHVIVMVNSDTYGGGGIYNQLTVTTTDHPTFRQVLVHEFGHAYGGLGDEYAYDDSYETIYPADTEPWEPNLTTLVDFNSKWADMLPKGTAIPTPPAKIPDYRLIRTEEERRLLNDATQRVGVFEGAGYQSKGVYRPAQECRMKINEVEKFCPVCSRALVRITDFYTSR